MMELAAAAFSAMFGTTATATAATAATSTASWLAGTTVTTAAGVTTSLAPAATAATLTGVQTALNAISIGAQIVSGVAAFQQSASQAQFAELNASQAILDARERSLRIRREMLEKTAQTRVAFAGSGLDISSGGEIEGALRRDADYEIGLMETTGEIKAAGLKAQAESYRTKGQVSLVRAAAGAAGSGTRTGIQIARRG